MQIAQFRPPQCPEDKHIQHGTIQGHFARTAFPFYGLQQAGHFFIRDRKPLGRVLLRQGQGFRGIFGQQAVFDKERAETVNRVEVTENATGPQVLPRKVVQEATQDGKRKAVGSRLGYPFPSSQRRKCRSWD